MRRDLWWLIIVVVVAASWPKLRSHASAPAVPPPFHSLTVCRLAPGFSPSDVKAALNGWTDAHYRYSQGLISMVSGSSAEFDGQPLHGAADLYERLGQPQIRAAGVLRYQHLTWTKLSHCLFEADVPDPGQGGPCLYRLTSAP